VEPLKVDYSYEGYINIAAFSRTNVEKGIIFSGINGDGQKIRVIIPRISLAKRTQELQGATREAALALKEKQAALAAATRAEQTANGQLGQASAQHQALSATIKALGAELGAMAKAAKATGDSSAEMAERLADGKAQLQVLRAEAGASAQNIKLLAAAQKESAAAMQNAGREVGAAQKQFDALRQSTKQNQTTLDAQNVSLQRADGTEEQMAGLAERIKQMTATLPLTAVELAKIAAAGGRAHREARRIHPAGGHHGHPSGGLLTSSGRSLRFGASRGIAHHANTLRPVQSSLPPIYRACDAAFIAPRFTLGRMVLATCLGQTVLLFVLALGASHATAQAVCMACRLIDPG
jgi:hypothetical protein